MPCCWEKKTSLICAEAVATCCTSCDAYCNRAGEGAGRHGIVIFDLMRGYAYTRYMCEPGLRDLQDRKHGRTRRELLREEYVEGSKHGGIGQPSTGFRVRFPILPQESACLIGGSLACEEH